MQSEKKGKTVQPLDELVRVVANRKRVARAPLPLVIGHVIADKFLPAVALMAGVFLWEVYKRVDGISAVMTWGDLAGVLEEFGRVVVGGDVFP